ncbi:MAG: hypothetical protein ACXAD7_24140 [Candidatus Kariarchaeaceae archaeon]
MKKRSSKQQNLPLVIERGIRVKQSDKFKNHGFLLTLIESRLKHSTT